MTTPTTTTPAADGDRLVSAREAAAITGRNFCMILDWCARGFFRAQAYGVNYAKMFRLSDVLREHTKRPRRHPRTPLPAGFLAPAEVAARLGVRPHRVRLWIKRGTLASHPAPAGAAEKVMVAESDVKVPAEAVAGDDVDADGCDLRHTVAVLYGILSRADVEELDRRKAKRPTTTTTEAAA